MELDEYKIIIRQKVTNTFLYKSIGEIEEYKRRKTLSVIDTVINNLKLEVVFALLFIIFDSCLMIFSPHFYLRIFTFLLLIFSVAFVYFLVKLFKYVQFQRTLIVPVRLLLERYIQILLRFTRLYFQLTMVMVPLLFILAFISGYLDSSIQSSDTALSFSSQRLWTFIGCAAGWSFMMYFFTRWYLKTLYGKYLNRLRQQLTELKEA